MTVEICGPSSLASTPTNASIVIGVILGPGGMEPGRGARLVAAELGVPVEALLTASDCDGSLGSIAQVVFALSDQPIRKLRFVGLGAEPDAAVLGKASMFAASDDQLVSTLPLEVSDQVEAVRSIVEGSLLGSYRPGQEALGIKPDLQLIVADPTEVNSQEIARATRVAAAVNWVRGLVDTPGGKLNPATFASEILRRAADANVQAILWDTDALRERGFGGTLAVGAASSVAPCAVVISNRGDSAISFGIAGKGITFDSGGINLKKNPSELVWMKSDMAAGAAVAAATIEAVRNNPGLNITAIIPIAENLVGAGAVRPGDVIAHPSGRTTEVTDTDSEGRLILADAIDWLCGQCLDLVVDVGTLTDGGGVGSELWGCWSASATDFVAGLLESGDKAGEPGWHLPLRESYASILESRVADSVNAPLDRPDSGQLAATFLRGFVGAHPWIHIDTGSTAWQEFALFPWSVGPTGSPTRALVEFLHRHGSR